MPVPISAPADAGEVQLASNLPLLDAGGDAFVWDTVAVGAWAADGSRPWSIGLSPTQACPAVLSQVSLTNLSTLVYVQAPLGRMFTYYPTGVPSAGIALVANNTGTAVYPPPPASLPTGSGVLLPISALAVAGSRILLLARYTQANSSSSSSGATNNGSGVYVAAVDQRPDMVARLWPAWQLEVPTGGTPLGSCVPSPATPAGAGTVALAVAGPLVATDDVGVVAMACGGFVRLAGFTIAHPRVAWLSDVALPGGDDDSVAGMVLQDGTPGGDPTTAWAVSAASGVLWAIGAQDGSARGNTTLAALAAGSGTPCDGVGTLTPASKPLLSATNATLMLAVVAPQPPRGQPAFTALMAIALPPTVGQPTLLWCVATPDYPPPASPRTATTQLAMVVDADGHPAVLLAAPTRLLAYG